MNFRADRARQMTRALTDPAFAGFPRSRVPRLGAYVCLTSYGDEFATLPAGVHPAVDPQRLRRVPRAAGADAAAHRRDREVRARHLFLQWRRRGRVSGRGPHHGPVAQGRDLRFEAGNERVRGHRQTGRRAFASRQYDAIVCNFANGDMVGHTGNLRRGDQGGRDARHCVGRVVAGRCATIGGEVLITADHGNVETMLDPATGQPHTAHTLNPVPMLYVGRPAHGQPRRRAAGHRADHAGADGTAAAGRDDRTLAGALGVRLTSDPEPRPAGQGTCGPGRGPSRTLDRRPASGTRPATPPVG